MLMRACSNFSSRWSRPCCCAAVHFAPGAFALSETSGGFAPMRGVQDLTSYTPCLWMLWPRLWGQLLRHAVAKPCAIGVSQAHPHSFDAEERQPVSRGPSSHATAGPSLNDAASPCHPLRYQCTNPEVCVHSGCRRRGRELQAPRPKHRAAARLAAASSISRQHAKEVVDRPAPVPNPIEARWPHGAGTVLGPFSAETVRRQKRCAAAEDPA
eukprot:7384436-Prymnesium_polylepis.1